MRWIIGGAGAFIALIAYSAVVVGARSDRDLEEWLAEKRREG
jgi:type IV secretory pathway TrbD component